MSLRGLPDVALIHIAQYLNAYEDLEEFACVDRAFHALLMGNTGNRAEVFVGRLGTHRAWVSLWGRMEERTPPFDNPFMTPANLEFALAVLGRPSVLRVMPHNALLDMVTAGISAFLGRPDTRPRIGEWSELLPGENVELLTTRTLLRPLQSMGSLDLERVRRAKASGFVGGLQMYKGRTRQGGPRLIALDEFMEEWDDLHWARDVLETVGPVDLRCIDLVDLCRKAGADSVADIMRLYKDQIHESDGLMLYFYQSLKRLKEGHTFQLDLSDVDPLVGKTSTQLLLMFSEELDKATDPNFDPRRLLAIVDSGHLGLEFVSARLLDHRQHPAVFQRLLNMLERRGQAEQFAIFHLVNGVIETHLLPAMNRLLQRNVAIKNYCEQPRTAEEAVLRRTMANLASAHQCRLRAAKDLCDKVPERWLAAHYFVQWHDGYL
jgi:hypothetical protein